jgi:hypothetical protein
MTDPASPDWKPAYSRAERIAWTQARLQYCDRILAEFGHDLDHLRGRLLEFASLAEDDPIDLKVLERFYRAISVERSSEGSGFGSLVSYVWGLRKHLTGAED